MTHSASRPTGLVRWLYASQCTLPSTWAGKAVEDIVAKSVQRNASLGVTGALLFTGARFVQFLEGPAESVAAIRESILDDPRHRQITTFATDDRTDRIFSNWSLAYAGPSVFVADKVDDLFCRGVNDSREIISLLEYFVISAL